MRMGPSEQLFLQEPVDYQRRNAGLKTPPFSHSPSKAHLRFKDLVFGIMVRIRLMLRLEEGSWLGT